MLICLKSYLNNGILIAREIGDQLNSLMETQKVKTCFTITFTNDQFSHAQSYVEDMKRHPQRVFWRGKEGKSDDELIIEQIAHRILSGFYNTDSYNASKHIVRMESMTAAR
jgi:hypothetical protein